MCPTQHNFIIGRRLNLLKTMRKEKSSSYRRPRPTPPPTHKLTPSLHQTAPAFSQLPCSFSLFSIFHQCTYSHFHWHHFHLYSVLNGGHIGYIGRENLSGMGIYRGYIGDIFKNRMSKSDCKYTYFFCLKSHLNKTICIKYINLQRTSYLYV